MYMYLQSFIICTLAALCDTIYRVARVRLEILKYYLRLNYTSSLYEVNISIETYLSPGSHFESHILISLTLLQSSHHRIMANYTYNQNWMNNINDSKKYFMFTVTNKQSSFKTRKTRRFDSFLKNHFKAIVCIWYASVYLKVLYLSSRTDHTTYFLWSSYQEGYHWNG